jgi:hypothetical protein
MVTKPTGQRRGRPNWDLSRERDKYFVAAFCATFFFENKFKGDSRVTAHAVAMTYAAIERGQLIRSPEILAVMSCGKGKLVFRTTISRKQFEERPKGHPIKARADDILRKARRAGKFNKQWLQAMTKAFFWAFYHEERQGALTVTYQNCLAADESDFFERSLKPFIVGRFDPAKRVFFGLPDFMPNSVPANRA